MKQGEKRRAYILWLKDVTMDDIALVGGKNAALGEMQGELKKSGIRVPDGFVVTVYAYQQFLKEAKLKQKIKKQLDGLDTKNLQELQKRAQAVRELIREAPFPRELKAATKKAYKRMEKLQGSDVGVAVRSSATLEDSEDASFAGQQETYLNVVGEEALLDAVKNVMASLFTDRAISYRSSKKLAHVDIGMAVGVQKMVRSDKGASGVLFTLDPETGFDKVILINGSYGLGEMLAQGSVIPDEFVVFKPALEQTDNGILQKRLGAKRQKMIYAAEGVKKVDVPVRDREKFCLQEKEVIQLAHWGLVLEKYFAKPMDIEWAKDGITKELFIVQARPETVHQNGVKNVLEEYHLKEEKEPLVVGMGVGMKIAVGKVRVVNASKDMATFQKGEILVTEVTDPDWEPIMKIATAIVTDKGGRTSHAAIVSREFGIPAIVGTEKATEKLHTGDIVAISIETKIGIMLS